MEISKNVSNCLLHASRIVSDGAAAASLLVLLGLALPVSAEVGKPNVILIMADDK